MLSVICFAISSVAENEEHYERQRPHAERYPKPKLARSSTLPSHLCGKGYRRKKTMKMKIDHASIWPSPTAIATITRNRRSNAGPQQKVRPPQLAASSFSQPWSAGSPAALPFTPPASTHRAMGTDHVIGSFREPLATEVRCGSTRPGRTDGRSGHVCLTLIATDFSGAANFAMCQFLPPACSPGHSPEEG